jgi:iron complex transport system ATP-binding protein
LIKISNLSCSINGINILDNVSFKVKKGTLCSLFGPNGAGKSTLMRCISRIYPFFEGNAYINDINIKKSKPKTAARLLAFVPQEHTITFPYLVKEVVLMGRTPYMGGNFGPSPADRMRTEEVMKNLNLIDIADRSYSELSGGQRQMVLLARALVQDTPVLLLDEPTSSLDFQNQMMIWDVMHHLVLNEKTLLVCTHDPNHVLWFCSQVVIMGPGGRILSDGPPEQVLSKDLLTSIYGDICSIYRIQHTMAILPNTIRTFR